MQKSGDQVRVNVQLIDARDDSHIWANNYDRKLTDIFAVESEIAAKIADRLQAKLSGAEQKAIAARPTENTEAHQLYLQGRFLSGKRTENDLTRALDYYRQAIEKDPNYALAYAAMAEAYAVLPDWSNDPAAGYFAKARAPAEKALALDDSLPEAHVSAALVLNNDFDVKGAKREFERAIELDPNHAGAHYFWESLSMLPWGNLTRPSPS